MHSAAIVSWAAGLLLLLHATDCAADEIRECRRHRSPLPDALIASKITPAAAGVPITRCKFGDSKCLANTITRVLQDHPQGIPEIGLAATDPLYYGNITVSQSGGGPVSMTLRLSDSSILGWSKAVVTKVV